MSSALTAVPAGQKRDVFPWLTVAWFAALLLIAYTPILKALVYNWYIDPDMGHGFFVPVIAAYIAWQKLPETAGLKARPNWWGLAIVIYGAIQLYIGTMGAELFLSRTSFLITLIGAVLLVGGVEYLRVFAFPLFLLFFMVPIPAILYNRITFPLQIIATQAADLMLGLMGYPVIRTGNILELPSQKLDVVEACSGIRSLLSLSFLSLVYGYFFEKKNWVRVVLFLSTIPIAIMANAGRVTMTGMISEIKPELAEGFFHEFQGWVIFMIALAIMVGLHQLLNRGYNFIHARRKLALGSQ
jgi:exosortase